jgi:xylulose-5-phosphate/fructose-6-phosphate phosphoketolase
MTLFTADAHPHGMPEERFLALFGADLPVIFAFHGYPGTVHQVLHGRPNPARFHARGFQEEGTTTTPFDMVVLNKTSRFHLIIEALRRLAHPPADTNLILDECHALLEQHHSYVREHFEDMPEVRDFRWPLA